MARTSLAFFIIAACLCLQIHASPFLKDVGSSGVVDIRKDSDGLYVEVDLKSYSSTQTGGEKSNTTSQLTGLTDDTVKMMVSFSNSETMVSLNCLNFTYYDCVRHDCYSTSPQAEVSYSRFIASAMVGEGPIFLDKKYWVLNETSPLYLAKSCQADSYLGFERYGILGLGSQSGDFKVSQKFSVYIKPDQSSGKLLFTGDKSAYTNSSKPIYTLPANTTWQPTIPRGYVEVTNYSIAFDNGNIIFDIHTDNIGLPYDLYQLFLSYFVRTPGVKCNSAIAEPSCSISGSFQDLPDIFLSFNDTQIRIPRTVYAVPDTNEDHSRSYFYLNLKAIGPSLSGTSYAPPAFQNSIILDAKFMSYYFTVFDATSGNNLIHLYPATPVNDPEPTHWIAIVVVVVIFLVIIGWCVKRNTGSGNKNTTTIVTNTTQEPLVYSYPSQPKGAEY